MADNMRWHDRVIEGYYTSSPDEVLMADEGDYFLEIHQVEWARVTAGHLDHDPGNQDEDVLIMKTAQGKIKMSARGMNTRSVRDLLTRADIRVK